MPLITSSAMFLPLSPIEGEMKTMIITMVTSVRILIFHDIS
jgi:hypothetical protein